MQIECTGIKTCARKPWQAKHTLHCGETTWLGASQAMQCKFPCDTMSERMPSHPNNEPPKAVLPVTYLPLGCCNDMCQKVSETESALQCTPSVEAVQNAHYISPTVNKHGCDHSEPLMHTQLESAKDTHRYNAEPACARKDCQTRTTAHMGICINRRSYHIHAHSTQVRASCESSLHSSLGPGCNLTGFKYSGTLQLPR